MIKKNLITFFILFLSMGIIAESYDDLFWEKISEGKFLSAAERGNQIGTQNPHYHLLSSFIYIILNNNEDNQIQFNLFQNKNSNYPPELIEEEFKHYLDKYKKSYVYSFIGSFVWQYSNLFNLNGQELMYQAIKMNKYDFIASNYLSMVEYNKGNIQKSLELALISIEESENYSEPYVNAANSYESLGKKNEAIEILFRALEECTEPHFNAYLSLFYKLGEAGSGIIQNFNQTLMAEMIHIDEESLNIFHDRLNHLPNIYSALLENLIEKGCYSETDYLLKKSSEVNISVEKKHYIEIKLFYKAYEQDSFNEAVNEFQNVRHKDPEIVADVAHMSLSYEKFDSAVDLYLKYIEMKPNQGSYRLMTSYSNIGTAYANLEKFDDAKKYWNMALEIVPDDEITLANMKKFSDRMNE